ncbi:MAG: thioredoxin domain-containing protein [Actinomycetota bacterium]
MANRLADAISPYLLQHSEDPVDWFEWGPEALEKAKREDKPILLSVGYAACHWCHVMAHESFQDPDTAAVMNERFVSIKVDREERPDIDRIYMAALQAMTRHGGWPMTMFLTPDLEPFFGGTYFPPEPRHGLPSFRMLLDGIWQQWTERREDCVRHGSGLQEMLERSTTLASEPSKLDDQMVEDGVRAFVEAIDPQWGGFGGAPKFPQAPALDLLLRAAARGDSDAASAVRLTLEKMARGGIFDHLGGGFCRYSTDRAWLVPHFEKMLSDNAQLLSMYARASTLWDEPLFERAASMTADFLLAELELPGGGFASSLDADSLDEEGRPAEGAFYTFGYDELIAAAGDDMPIAIAAFALAGPGNWEGKTILWRPIPDQEIAEQIGKTVEEVAAAIERLRAAWFKYRSKRPRPGRDDKMVTAWNGMAIGALAEAAMFLGRPELLSAARRTAEAVLTRARDERGRLQRAWRDGRTSGPGFLDDHAELAAGLLTLAAYDPDPRWFSEAMELTDQMVRLFSDDRGGFYETGQDTESLLIRPKEMFDDATPAGNATASTVILRSASLGAGPGEDVAKAFLEMMAPALGRAPTGFAATLAAVDRVIREGKELLVVGAEQAEGLRQVAGRRFDPDLVMLAWPSDGPEGPPITEGRLGQPGQAFLCQGMVCGLPAKNPDQLSSQLGRN